MAISLVGAVGVTTDTALGSVTGTYGQSPTASNLLVACIGWYGTTLETWAPSTPSGWTGLMTPTGNNGAGASHSGLAFFYKAAAGGDAAPAFTQTSAGAAFGMTCVIWELSGASTTAPLDTSGVYQSGSTSIAFPTMTATTGANVPAASEYAMSAFVQNNLAATAQTWTETGTGWTSRLSGATSTQGHIQVNSQAAPTSGAALTDSGHYASGAAVYAAGVVVVIAGAAGSTSPNAAAAASTGVPPASTPTVGLNMTIQGV